jgi:ornithine--oxo-acid transaminase
MVPCSATLGTKKVFESVFSRLDRCVVHSSTFSENNLAMAAALSVLDQVERKDLVTRSAAMGELVRVKLKAALKDFELVKEIRGRGLMFAVEFGAPKSMKLKMGWSLVQKANKGLFGQMITMPLLTEQNILSQVAGHNLNVLKLSPPLTITEAEIDRFVSGLTEVVKECHRFPGGLWDFGLGLAKRAILPASVSP